MPLHCWDRAYIHTRQSCRAGHYIPLHLLSAEHPDKKYNFTPSGKATSAKKGKGQPVSRTAATAASCAGHQSPVWMAGKGSTEPHSMDVAANLLLLLLSPRWAVPQEAPAHSLGDARCILQHMGKDAGGGGKIHHGSFSKPH